jgi:hypothetical protein
MAVVVRMNDRAVRSKSSLYFERYAGAERQAAAMGFAVYILGAVCFLLAAGLIVVISRPKAIHYVPAAPMAGLSYPDRVPSSSALSFSSAWLMNWLNYSPKTAEEVYERSLVFMAPSFLAKVKAGLDEELQKIARDKISSVFTLKEEPWIEESVLGFKITFVGERGIYVGKEEMSREEVRFIVDVRRAYPTDTDPYGLVVFDVIKERISSAAF